MPSPTLTGIEALGPATTGGASVQFRLTFSESVTGIGPANISFDLTGSLAGVALTSIAPDPGGASYLVTATTGTGEGGLRIAFDPLGVVNAAGEPFANAAGLFRDGGGLTGNTTSYGIGIGDLDGDGDADLVSTDFIDGTVSVLLNDGRGGFAASVHYGVTGTPLRSTIADLNGDGRPEIIASPAYDNPGTLAVADNNGDGSFSTRSIAASSFSYGVAAVDLDGDGRRDLLLPDNGAGLLRVMLGQGDGPGDGTFAAAIAYQTGPGVLSVTTADLNGDGGLDVVVPNNTGGSLSVLFNDGSGGLLPQVAYGTGLEPRDVLAMDIDQDGDIDLVVGSSENALQLLLNRGDGTFAEGASLSLAGSAYRLAGGDIDADGRPDIVAATTQGVVVLRSTGGGGFAPPETFFDGAFTFDVALGDLDGDRRLDIVAATGGATLQVLLNTATSFTSPGIAIDHVAPQGSAVLSGGGDPDAATLTYAVTFSEPVTGIGPASFQLLAGGTVSGGIAEVTGAGASYQVTVTGLQGFGLLQLLLVGAVADAAGNAAQWTPPALHEVDRNIPLSGGVAIQGVAQRGSPLLASDSLADGDGRGPLAYRWQREADGGFTDIPGATGAAYTPGRDDIGHALRLVVGYEDGRGHAESVASAPTLAVAAATIPLAPPLEGSSTSTGLRSLDIAARLADGDLLALPPGTARLVLADGVIDHDAGSDAAFLGRLYAGLFGRQGDALGLAFWDHRGEPMDRVATALGFAASPEYADTHGRLNDADFVASLYQDLLRHGPDAAGQAYFLAQIAAGATRGQVTATIADSFEARQLWQAESAAGIFVPGEYAAAIRAAYAAAFGREADPGGLVYFGQMLEGGLTIGGLGDVLAGSAEFTARHGARNDHDFVTALYRDGLDRVGSAGETGFYEALLADGQFDRGDVLAVFAAAPETQGLLEWPL